MCVGCAYYSYSHIQRLVVELNSYVLTVLITEIRLVTISSCVPHISPLLIWILWNKGTYMIRSYTMSTRIQLYLSLPIWRMWHKELTHMVIISVCYSHPIYVPILTQVMSSVNVGRCGHKWGRETNMGRFRPSCVRLVYFLRKSTEFHVKRTECQRILFHFLLLIF